MCAGWPLKNMEHMDEHLFLKGQRVITKDGERGEVVDATGDRISVRLDSGVTKEFPSGELQDNSNAG